MSLPPIRDKTNSYMSFQPISLVVGNTTTNLRISERSRTIVCKTPIHFEKICALIEQFKIEHASAPMWTLLDFVHNPVVNKYDLSSLKGLVSGGQYVPHAVMEAVKDRINADVVSIYGSTEIWRVSSTSLYDDSPEGDYINVISRGLLSYSCLLVFRI